MNQVNLHERAVSYGYAVAGGSLERGHIQEAYEKGATEQREIDIQRASIWLEDCLPDIEYSVLGSKFDQGKHVFIDTFKQAMGCEDMGNFLEQKVAIHCIGKSVIMTIQELINYYVDSECTKVAKECNF